MDEPLHETVRSVEPATVDIGPFRIVIPPGTRADEAARFLYLVARALERGETDLRHLVLVIRERNEE